MDNIDRKYKCLIALKSAFKGPLFQVKLLMLFIIGAIENKWEFELATELKSAEGFDDLVIRYKNGSSWIYRLLQAKHKEDPDRGRITVAKLISIKNDDVEFSILNYFKSFCEIIKRDVFNDEKKLDKNIAHKNCKRIKDLIIITNTDFAFEINNRENEINDELSNTSNVEESEIAKKQREEQTWIRFFMPAATDDDFLSVQPSEMKISIFNSEMKDKIESEIKKIINRKIEYIEVIQNEIVSKIMLDGSSIINEYYKSLNKWLANKIQNQMSELNTEYNETFIKKLIRNSIKENVIHIDKKDLRIKENQINDISRKYMKIFKIDIENLKIDIKFSKISQKYLQEINKIIQTHVTNIKERRKDKQKYNDMLSEEFTVYPENESTVQLFIKKLKFVTRFPGVDNSDLDTFIKRRFNDSAILQESSGAILQDEMIKYFKDHVEGLSTFYNEKNVNKLLSTNYY